MTLALTHSIALLGLEGHLVTVEVDIADGLPGYALLGLPDAALSESRDRVRSAIVNCGEVWPNRKVTVSLSPAWLPKSQTIDLRRCLKSSSNSSWRCRIEIRPLRGIRYCRPGVMATQRLWKRLSRRPATPNWIFRRLRLRDPRREALVRSSD